jgi:hypothetical protein
MTYTLQPIKTRYESELVEKMYREIQLQMNVRNELVGVGHMLNAVKDLDQRIYGMYAMAEVLGLKDAVKHHIVKNQVKKAGEDMSYIIKEMEKEAAAMSLEIEENCDYCNRCDECKELMVLLKEIEYERGENGHREPEDDTIREREERHNYDPRLFV